MPKNILVTGASTGIGYDTVRALAAEGFNVIATVRKESDREILIKDFSNNVKVLILDVTNLASVELLPAQLKQLGVTELAGLVNNAGVAMAAPFQHQPFEEIQNMIQVNVLSLMKVTQVLLPLLGAYAGAKTPGRIVNISSIAGKSAAPFLSVYAASKFAVEGFAEGLRKELMLYGIKVINIGPGSIRTPIWQKGFAVVKEKYNQTAYAGPFQKFISMALAFEKTGLEVAAVSKLVVRALHSSGPAFRYAPIPNPLMSWYIPQILPARTYNWVSAKVLGLMPKPKS
ncbi:MAG: SDR family NAD(P)-dependent oxidoreductase [Bdellovibrionaceae bacterium]|nr:SDR family NAD(P)-dependent oxidoreductase [Bdellovibrio sp.]